MSDPKSSYGEPVEEPTPVDDDVVGRAEEGLADAEAARRDAVATSPPAEPEPARARTASPSPWSQRTPEPARAGVRRRLSPSAEYTTAADYAAAYGSDADDTAVVAPVVTPSEPVADAAYVAPVVAAAPVAPQPIFVQAPEAPRLRGNRAAAGAIGLLAALSFAVLYLAAWLGFGALAGDVTAENFVDTLVGALGTWSLWVTVVVFFLAFWLLGAIINRGRWGAWVIFGLLVGFASYGGHLLGQLFQAPFWMLTASEGAQLIEDQLLRTAGDRGVRDRPRAHDLVRRVGGRTRQARDRAQHRGAARVRAHARGGPAARPAVGDRAPGAAGRTGPPAGGARVRHGGVRRAADLRARHAEPRARARTSSRRRGLGQIPGILAVAARDSGVRRCALWAAVRMRHAVVLGRRHGRPRRRFLGVPRSASWFGAVATGADLAVATAVARADRDDVVRGRGRRRRARRLVGRHRPRPHPRAAPALAVGGRVRRVISIPARALDPRPRDAGIPRRAAAGTTVVCVERSLETQVSQAVDAWLRVAAPLGARDAPGSGRAVPAVLRVAGPLGRRSRRRRAARRAARAVHADQDDRRPIGGGVHRPEPADAAGRARSAGGAQPRAQLPAGRRARARVRGAAARPRSRSRRAVPLHHRGPRRRGGCRHPGASAARPTRRRPRSARRSASPTTTRTWSGREVCTILLHHRLRIQAAISRVRRAADRGDARGADPLARCAVRPERPVQHLSLAGPRAPRLSPPPADAQSGGGGFVSMARFADAASARPPGLGGTTFGEAR